MELKNIIEARSEPITESGCWIWTASQMSNGYGDFRHKGKHWTAHRAAYEAFIGQVPDGMHVLHRCDVRECCNPNHLFLGTNQDNISDSMKKNRRKSVTRNRPSGLKYNWTKESKIRWIENKRKLDASQRCQVMHLYNQGWSQRKLAKFFVVSPTTIFNIVHGKGVNYSKL